MLYLSAYGHCIGLQVDPIEKKPLYHFLPGSTILSFGTIGCSLGCKFCQNWEMSRAKSDENRAILLTPIEIVELALEQNCPSIAYTYNEPTIYGEFVRDVSRIARKAGLKNVLVTNGYITEEARSEVYEFIDAANVDLKSFNPDFYRKTVGAELADVLKTIKWLVSETEVWVELTNLIIPGKNDDTIEIEKMINWVLENCGDDVPLHFSAFHPAYKMQGNPSTPPEKVIEARKIALKLGVKYVYTGNIPDSSGNTTFCPKCKKPLNERGWFSSRKSNLLNGKCGCGEVIEGVYQ